MFARLWDTYCHYRGDGDSMNGGVVQRRSSRRIVTKSLLLGALALLAVATAIPSKAEAGQYVVKECFFQDPIPPDPLYSTTGALAFTPDRNCFTQVRVAIGTQGSFTPSGALEARWTWYAPSGAYIDTVSFQRATESAGNYSAAIFVCGGTICNGYTSDDTNGGYQSASFGPGGWTSFFTWLICTTAPCNGALARVWIGDVSFTLVDVTNPVVSDLGGSLLGPGPKRGVETLTASSSDAGSGVRSIQVKVNGAQVDSRQFSCDVDGAGIGNQLRPCGSGNASFSVNTESAQWVAGQNLVEICAYDYASGSSPNAGCAQRTVVIDNSCPNSSGGPQATALDAGLQDQGAPDPLSPTLAVRSDEGATVRGSVTGPGGPVGGANVCLYEKVDVPGDVRQLVETTKSKSDGTFSAQVDPGPSRMIDVVYRFNNQAVEKTQLYLDSSVKPDLKVKPRSGLTNGETTGFIGEIPGPNAEGRGISLQAKAGQKWRTFKQIKTNKDGRFRGRYKFNHTSGRVTYKFRARVKRQGGYPYSPGSSAKKKVKVRG